MALGKQGLEPIEHGIPPVFDERSEVPVSGTMPSLASRGPEAAFHESGQRRLVAAAAR